MYQVFGWRCVSFGHGETPFPTVCLHVPAVRRKWLSFWATYPESSLNWKGGTLTEGTFTSLRFWGVACGFGGVGVPLPCLAADS